MADTLKPTLAELRERAAADIAANVDGADDALRFRVLSVLSSVIAGMGDEVLRRVEYLLRQVFIADCDEDFLVRHGQEIGIPRKPPARAEGSATVDASLAGAVIPAGALLKRADGVSYTVSADTIVGNDGVAVFPIVANDAGEEGNDPPFSALSFTSPVAGVASRATVASGGVTGGADIEDAASYRARLLAYIRTSPAGGCDADYVNWALSCDGVSRAWCSPCEMGPGTVTVRFVMDGVYENGIPTAADVERVRAAVAAKAPVTAILYVLSPVADPVDFVFASLSPATLAARQAVAENLRALVLDSAVAPGGVLRLSKIRAAISNATGNEDFELVSPSSDIECAAGHLIVMGDITWPEGS